MRLPFLAICSGKGGFLLCVRHTVRPMCQPFSKILKLCAQAGYALSPVKLLEKDDVIYAWRERMMAAYSGICKNAVGHPESL